jgi:hypothetical protein
MSFEIGDIIEYEEKIKDRKLDKYIKKNTYGMIINHNFLECWCKVLWFTNEYKYNIINWPYYHIVKVL